MKKVAIVLSGCGVNDGSEIHEAVLTLLHVVKASGQAEFYAPDIAQHRTVNHLSGKPEAEQRNILKESARIARGHVKDLKRLNSQSADALIFPGGFGAAINLCNFAEAGAHCVVNPEVERVITEFHRDTKPVGFICIAPVIAAKVLGSHGIELTIGNDQETAAAIEAMGARHVKKDVHQIQIDEENKVVSTPAYMLAENIAEAESGIAKLCQAVLELAA